MEMRIDLPNTDWLIAGLGNPEPKYDATRHNAGFEALDYLAAQWQCPLNKSKWQADQCFFAQRTHGAYLLCFKFGGIRAAGTAAWLNG